MWLRVTRVAKAQQGPKEVGWKGLQGWHLRMSVHRLAMKGFSLFWSVTFLASFRDEVGSEAEAGSEAGTSGPGSVLARAFPPSSQS